ncbi:hypothetical protein H5410_039037 [Solanum commersonii]|uniref:Uncharacterized protein n=1 Tax=Solanum commersonii TaxID=4109 RepID=A0A9J5YCG2_SOLCO|nr:hypothetical protein H5410_039037 [Solanum commersonii]
MLSKAEVCKALDLSEVRRNMASRLGSEIEALCLGKIIKPCSLRNYVKILVYFDSYVVKLSLRILTCLIYDWADHRQVELFSK